MRDLMQLGALSFRVIPFGLNAVAYGRGADHAPKNVIGTMRPREFVGVGDERIDITGTLFPETFPDKRNSRYLLDDMRRSGLPYLLMRGDGRNLGWFVIESVSEEESVLDAFGRGKLVEYTLSLARVPGPRPADYLRVLFQLFA